MKNIHWWKWLGVLLVGYSIVMGFMGKVPAQAILHETIRNLYFHVTMWFAMMGLLIASIYYSIKQLSSSTMHNDLLATETAHVAMLLGTCGIITGSLWARYTWGAWWTDDAKLNGVAASMLFYLAYFVLRNSIDDDQKRARIAAVYNIFCFVMLIVFIWVRPRLTDSLHPGNGGNPGFGKYDLDSNMRLVFYPAIIGWILVAAWLVQLRVRIANLTEKIEIL
ncbi:MAG: cytochrome c biogenesis protein CcsA [Bacteroidia bacterium]|nr:cytochrome c biogenesis protein CcsA [Bacteroidia bacterium]